MEVEKKLNYIFVTCNSAQFVRVVYHLNNTHTYQGTTTDTEALPPKSPTQWPKIIRLVKEKEEDGAATHFIISIT